MNGPRFIRFQINCLACTRNRIVDISVVDDGLDYRQREIDVLLITAAPGCC
jgi:hypothetical protein